MSEFNFKSSVCTSREQSKRLLALGLKKETADMFYSTILENDDIARVCYKDFWNSNKAIDVYIRRRSTPAWSLHRLIEMTPSDMRGYMCKNIFDEKYAIDEQFDELIATIGYYIKEGYFKKEYLV